MIMSNLVKKASNYLSRVRGRVRRYIAGDNSLSKVMGDGSYTANPELRYMGFSCVAIHYYFYKEEYIGSIQTRCGKGICYATGLTLADLFADFVNKVDAHIKI